MRYSVVAVFLAAVSAAAMAQEEETSPWQIFEEDGGRNGASVRAEDGSQLVLKCDKPGRREVHAIILSGSNKLAVPNQRPISRPITFQFDGASPKTESWGFYEQHAITQGKSTNDRTLARFISGLRGSSKVRMRLDTGISSDVVLDFDVTGASEAIARVYELCRDTEPA